MIGIFDSGVGGLTVAKEIIKKYPDQKVVYFGDTARVPYGNKSPEIVQKYSKEIVQFLKEKGCKVIVIACNTASALAGDYLRKEFHQLKIIDVIDPAVEIAIKKIEKYKSKDQKIGVIGTRATINSTVYTKKIKDLRPKIEVFSQACPLFVPLAEEHWGKRIESRKIARVYLKELKDKKIKVLILGCTHYPLLEKLIQGVIGKNVKLINSAKAVAEKINGSISKEGTGDNEFYFSDISTQTKTIADRILGKNIKLNKTLR